MGKKTKKAKKKHSLATSPSTIAVPVETAPKKDGLLNTIVQHPLVTLLVILATIIGTFACFYFGIFPRLDTGLNSKVDYLTNAASASVDSGNTFALKINGNEIPDVPSDMDTNGMIFADFTKAPIIKLNESRNVSIQANNLKEFEVDKLSVFFDIPLAATNLNISGSWQGPFFQFSDINGDWVGWRTVLDFPAIALGRYTPTTFSISTNVTKRLIPVRIEINSLGRKMQRYFAVLDF